MNKSKKNILLVFSALVLTIIISIVLWFLFFKKEITNINIKTLPKDCENYVIINTDKINTQLSSYFFKNPSLLLKLFENTETIQKEFDDVNFLLNEPISIFWDEKKQITGAYFSVNQPNNIDVSNYDINEVTVDNNLMYLNNNKNTLYYRDNYNNQIRMFLSDDEIIPREIFENYISSNSLQDTSSYNKSALKHFNESDNSVIFNIKNDISIKMGTINNFGTIDFNKKEITLTVDGNYNDQFIFDNKDSLITICNTWGSFSANLNENIVSSFNEEKAVLFKNWDGRLSIGLNSINNISELMNISKIGDLISHVELCAFVGNNNDTILENINTDYGLFKSYKNKESGYGLGLNKTNLLKKEKPANFNGNIDFEKLFDLDINSLSWTSIKTVLKRFNLKNIEMNCNSLPENKYKLNLKIKSLDSTKHIILSPFIY